MQGAVDQDFNILDGLPPTHTSSGPKTSSFASGATISAMTLVYMGSSSKWLITDADAIATMGLLAVSLEAKNNTQLMSVALGGSFISDASWSWTIGGVIYASGTLGEFTQTQPVGVDAVIRVLGYAVTATTIWFQPEQTWITHT